MNTIMTMKDMIMVSTPTKLHMMEPWFYWVSMEPVSISK